MSPLIPIILTALSVCQPSDDAPAGIMVSAEPGVTVSTVVAVDSIPFADGKVVFGDVLADNGASRRIVTAYGADGVPTDVIDGGSWGGSGLIDRLYFTDRRGDTMTGWLEVADASPAVGDAPEGGKLIEFTDRVTLTLLNHDTSETEVYTLRDNQVTYLLADGRFRLLSIRPKPDDLQQTVRYLRVYDTEADDDRADRPLDYVAFSTLLKQLFPIPGRVNAPK